MIRKSTGCTEECEAFFKVKLLSILSNLLCSEQLQINEREDNEYDKYV
jgi:hypothetical protein